jgi:hypothetical protein
LPNGIRLPLGSIVDAKLPGSGKTWQVRNSQPESSYHGHPWIVEDEARDKLETAAAAGVFPVDVHVILESGRFQSIPLPYTATLVSAEKATVKPYEPAEDGEASGLIGVFNHSHNNYPSNGYAPCSMTRIPMDPTSVFSLHHSEFIVYDTSQVRMRYLVHVTEGATENDMSDSDNDDDESD